MTAVERLQAAMSRPKLLDCFCCEGGAAVGYDRAGFDVYGVDIEPQLRYPFAFHQGDALDIMRRLLAGESIAFATRDEHSVEWLTLSDFAVIHASPPCQGYLNLGAVNRAMGRAYDHETLIGATRELLLEAGLPYVIENVADASSELIDPIRVCGTGLGLPIRRHRLFETTTPMIGIACEHHRFTEAKYWTSWRPNGEHRLSTVVQVYGNAGGREEWPAAMGIDWMTTKGMVEAVPPAYTSWIGSQLLAVVKETTR